MSAHAATKGVIVRHVPVWLVPVGASPLSFYPWLASVPRPDSHMNYYARTWVKALAIASPNSSWEPRGWSRFVNVADGAATWRLVWRCRDCPMLSPVPATVGIHPHRFRSTARQGGVEL